MDCPLQVCLVTSVQQADGSLSFTEAGQITRVPAGSEAALSHGICQDFMASYDASADGSAQQRAWRDDAEEEEAFLESVTRQHASQQQQACEWLLKCRCSGTRVWTCQLVLREAMCCTIGMCCVHVQHQCKI